MFPSLFCYFFRRGCGLIKTILNLWKSSLLLNSELKLLTCRHLPSISPNTINSSIFSFFIFKSQDHTFAENLQQPITPNHWIEPQNFQIIQLCLNRNSMRFYAWTKAPAYKRNNREAYKVKMIMAPMKGIAVIHNVNFRIPAAKHDNPLILRVRSEEQPCSFKFSCLIESFFDYLWESAIYYGWPSIIPFVLNHSRIFRQCSELLII